MSCPNLCPEDEAMERTERDQLSKFEKFTARSLTLHPCHHHGLIKIEGTKDMWALPVKSYSREKEDSSRVRPIEILEETMDHLTLCVLSIQSFLDEMQHPFMFDLYPFLNDRLRAIKKDLMAQNCARIHPERTIVVLEQAISCLIFCGSVVNDGVEQWCQQKTLPSFDTYLHKRRLVDFFDYLFLAYAHTHGTENDNESRFRNYMLLLELGDSSVIASLASFNTLPLIKPDKAEKQKNTTYYDANEAVIAQQLILAVFKAYHTCNYVHFFQVCSRMEAFDPLFDCLLSTDLRINMQVQAISIMNSTYMPKCFLPITTIRRSLNFDSDDEAAAFIDLVKLPRGEGGDAVQLRVATVMPPTAEEVRKYKVLFSRARWRNERFLWHLHKEAEKKTGTAIEDKVAVDSARLVDGTSTVVGAVLQDWEREDAKIADTNANPYVVACQYLMSDGAGFKEIYRNNCCKLKRFLNAASQ